MDEIIVKDHLEQLIDNNYTQINQKILESKRKFNGLKNVLNDYQKGYEIEVENIVNESISELEKIFTKEIFH